VERNNCKHITTYEGEASLLSDKNYDIIIANINRNILLSDIPTYASCLPEDGILLLSGFYTEDIPLISEKCNEHGLYFVSNYERNNWVACKFEKRG
jgi:ribosomal protein L11 methyltransferase